jgi:aquaporin Z
LARGRVGDVFRGLSGLGRLRGVDRRWLRGGAADVAVIESETEDAAPSRGRPAARLAMEATGSFLLVSAFGLALTAHSWSAPLLVSLPLLAMVFPSRRLPQAHCHPALTLAMLLSARIGLRCAVALWSVQFAAGLSAAAAVRAVVGQDRLAITMGMVQGLALIAALVFELVVTCALCHGVLGASTRHGDPVDASCGRFATLGAIAAVIAIGAVTALPNTGVAQGDTLFGIVDLPTLRVYLVSQLLGGIAAPIAFLTLTGDH